MKYHCVVCDAGKMSGFTIETESLASLVRSLLNDHQEVIQISAYARRFDRFVPVLTARDRMPEELGRKWLKQHFPGYLGDIHEWIDAKRVNGYHSLLRTTVRKDSLADALVDEARHHLLVPSREGARTISDIPDFCEIFDALECLPAQLNQITSLDRESTFKCLDYGVIPLGRDADGQLLMASTGIVDEEALGVALRSAVRQVVVGENVEDNARMFGYLNRRFTDLHPDYQEIDANPDDCFDSAALEARSLHLPCRTEAFFMGFAELLHGEDNVNTRLLRQVFRKGIEGGAYGYEILVGEKIEAGHLFDDGKAGYDSIPRPHVEHHICRLAALGGIAPGDYEEARMGETIEVANGQLMLDTEVWIGDWGPNLRMTWLLAR
ncbi:MAG: hypothetical protein ACI8W8_003900 [Rhodothermales bacterium]|jgi:hypothetical protein